MTQVLAGALRLGPYTLIERLGVGGMAEVYVAERAGPHGFAKKFAIKRILPQLARDARFVEMFCDEARICAALCHPNIVQVVDFGESSGELFMAMEYVDGVSTAKLLRAVASRRERIPLEIALFIADEVLRALSYAHEACDPDGTPLGIVHRDVSPGNVLIGRSGEVKLTDFGIVRSAFVDRRTYPGELKGKIGYMSPEQVVGRELDARSDLFTLAIILTEMVLLRPLFPGRSEVEILSRIHEADLSLLDKHTADLPTSLLEVLRKALSRSVERRFQTAREFSEALNRIAREQGLLLGERSLVTWLSELGLLPERTGPQQSGKVRAQGLEQGEGHLSSATRPKVSGVSEPIERSPLPTLEARMIWLRSPEGKVTGPVACERFASWVATGRVPENTSVRDLGGIWQPLRELPDMPLLERHAYRFGRKVEGADRLEVERKNLPATLYRLILQASNGVLVARSADAERHIYFEQGAIGFVSSTEKAELLGQRLLTAGALNEEELSKAIALGLARRKHLGEVLMQFGFLKPSMLLRVLIEQLEHRFLELGRMHAPELRFAPDLRAGEELPRRPKESLSLVTRLVRERYTDGELSTWLGALDDRRLRRGNVRNVDPIALGLTQPERRALELAATTGQPLGRLFQELATDRIARPDEARRGVFVGLSLGLLNDPFWIQ